MLHKKSSHQHDVNAFSEKAQNALHSLHLEGIELSSDALHNIYLHDAGQISDDEFMQRIASQLKKQ